MIVVGDKYKILKHLGEGGYSTVKLAQNNVTNEAVAIKIMEIKKMTDRTEIYEAFKNEVRALKVLKHPNIIKMKEYSTKDVGVYLDSKTVDLIYISLEYFENGDLYELLQAGGPLPEPIARYYFQQILTTLKYVHHKGYAHGDLKLENFLLDSEFEIKLADFGFANKNTTSNQSKGTKNYMTTEMLLNQSYNPKEADLFASIIVLFSLITGSSPFKIALSSDSHYNKILSGDWESFWLRYEKGTTKSPKISSTFKDFFQRFSIRSSHSKLNMDKIKSHEWFLGKVASKREVVQEMNRRKALNNPKVDTSKCLIEETHTAGVISNSSNLDNSFSLGLDQENMRGLKYSEFYKGADSEDLVNLLTQFAIAHGHKYSVNNEFYQVKLGILRGSEWFKMTANILKDPYSNNRCVQFVNDDSEQREAIFRATCAQILCRLDDIYESI